MLSVTCENCGSHFRVAEQFAGRKAKCPKCECIFRLPAESVIEFQHHKKIEVCDKANDNVSAVPRGMSHGTANVPKSASPSESLGSTLDSWNYVRIAASIAVGLFWLYLGYSLNGVIGVAGSIVAFVACASVVYTMRKYGATEQLSLSKPAGWAVMLFAKPFVVLFGPIGAALFCVWCGGRKKGQGIYEWSRGAQWVLLGSSIVTLMGSVVVENWLKSMSVPQIKAVSENSATESPVLNDSRIPTLKRSTSKYEASPVQNETWVTVTMPGLCSYQIPPTLEVQKGLYKLFMDQFKKSALEIDPSVDRVVAQPKGTNDLVPAAMGRYSRIIVETIMGAKGDFSKLDETYSAPSPAELRELDVEFKKEVQLELDLATSRGSKMTMVSWQPVKVVEVNGVVAIQITYTRSINDNTPALVHNYLIQNNDVMHSVIISYRESEKELWAEDLDKVISTFKFEKR